MTYGLVDLYFVITALVAIIIFVPHFGSQFGSGVVQGVSRQQATAAVNFALADHGAQRLGG